MVVFFEVGIIVGLLLDVNKFVNIVGVVVFFGLIVGVGVWGYKLVMCDVIGLLVVCVMEGLMCVVFSNLGGEIVLNVGLLVNEVVVFGGVLVFEEVEIVVFVFVIINLIVEDLIVELVELVILEVVVEVLVFVVILVEVVNLEVVGIIQFSVD